MNELTKALLEDFVEQAFKIAKDNVTSDSDALKISPAALCLSSTGGSNYVMMLPWNSDETKVQLLNELGKKCFEKKFTRLVHINDAALKQYEKIPDPDTELPLHYPPTMRVDCLVLAYIDFTDYKENILKAYPYKIIDGKIVREKEISLLDNSPNIINNVMLHVSYGFVKTAIIDECVRAEITEGVTKDIGDMFLKKVLEKYPGALLGMSNEEASTDENT